ncbi:hypothetical protein GCM10028895_25810 [Pontibacter rugosus]
MEVRLGGYRREEGTGKSDEGSADMIENSEFDKKSLRVVQGISADWAELAKDCFAFANAKGGEIYIGIEDDTEMPPADQ